MSKFQHLVVDTAAFINNVQLQNIAETCYTVQGVLDEIRNDRQMKALAVLPYDLKLKQPDPSVLAKVVAFAKKTGDFASLSLVDLQVIALTYELETMHVGREHLREEPKPAITVSAFSKPFAGQGTELMMGFYVPKKELENSVCKGLNMEDGLGIDTSDSGFFTAEDLTNEVHGKLSLDSVQEERQPKQSQSDRKQEQDIENEEHEDEMGEVILRRIILDSVQEEQVEPDQSDSDQKEEQDTETGDSSEENEVDGDDDDSGWITPSNIAQVKRNFSMDCLEDSPSPVACITTDFAVQNVLKQIGLQVAALDGRVIRQARTYILRCYACFKTTPDATKVFCPRCGNRTLKKVSVSLNTDGQQVIHINSRHPLTAKYKNRPVAKFTGGKHATNPLLYEDQPLPHQRISAKARCKTNALGDEYTTGYSPFVMRDVDSRSAVLRGSANLKQRMTNCEYDNKRRGYRK